MSLEVIFLLIPLFTILLGFFVYFKSSHNRLNLLFLFMTLSMSVWMVFNFLVDVVSTVEAASYLARADFATASIMVYFFLIFCLNFPKPKDKFPVSYIVLLLIAIFFAILSFFTNLVIKGVDIVNGGYEVKYNSFEIIYDLFIVAYVIIGGIGGLYLNFRKTVGHERNQILVMFIGLIILALLVTGANLFGAYLFPNVPTINRVGFLGFVIFVSFTAYAIIQKQLFDIRIILTETASALVVLALFVQTLLSENLTQWLVNGLILLLVTYGGYLLIKSVQEEIKRRKQLQTLSTQLAHANEHLKELDRMKTEFVSLASHELLTPVSAIEGYLSMLLDEKLAKVDDPKAKQYLDRVYRSAKRLARLVADMLNVSRIEEGRLLVEKKEVDLSELIKQTVEELKFKAEEKKQKIVFQDNQRIRELDNQKDNQSSDHQINRSSTPEAFMTYGDPDKIKEVIVNLVGNSIKYSKDPGEITLKIEKVPTAKVQEEWSKVEADIKARPLDDQEAIKSAVDERLKRLVGAEQLLISVKDQGVGIPKEELSRLFKKFHRVGDYTTAESQGTGLGLYISRALVELHHGRIWADSEGPSHGSTFTFSLPIISSKKEIEDLEAQVPQDKAKLKPLARTMKGAEEL